MLQLWYLQTWWHKSLAWAFTINAGWRLSGSIFLYQSKNRCNPSVSVMEVHCFRMNSLIWYFTNNILLLSFPPGKPASRKCNFAKPIYKIKQIKINAHIDITGTQKVRWETSVQEHGKLQSMKIENRQKVTQRIFKYNKINLLTDQLIKK